MVHQSGDLILLLAVLLTASRCLKDTTSIPDTATVDFMGRRPTGETEDELKRLAQEEMDAAKDRLTKRTAAARDYAAAAARLRDATATWERIQGETTTAKAKAVADLLDSEMKAPDVAKLLGIDAKELRILRSVSPEVGQSAEASAPQDHAAA